MTSRCENPVHITALPALVCYGYQLYILQYCIDERNKQGRSAKVACGIMGGRGSRVRHMRGSCVIVGGYDWTVILFVLLEIRALCILLMITSWPGPMNGNYWGQMLGDDLRIKALF